MPRRWLPRAPAPSPPTRKEERNVANKGSLVAVVGAAAAAAAAEDEVEPFTSEGGGGDECRAPPIPFSPEPAAAPPEADTEGGSLTA